MKLDVVPPIENGLDHPFQRIDAEDDPAEGFHEKRQLQVVIFGNPHKKRNAESPCAEFSPNPFFIAHRLQP